MVQPSSTARVIGRTPCTRNSRVRCRLLRLVSNASHCWKRAFSREIRRSLTPETSRPRQARSSGKSSAAASCSLVSFLRALAGSRSPKTVPRCGRSRAAGSARAARRPRTSPARRPGRSRRPAARSGRAHGTNAPGKDRQPSSSSSRLRSLPSGSVSAGLQTTPTVRSPSRRGSRRRTSPGPRRSGRPPGRPRRRRTSWRPCRRRASRSSSSYAVTGLLRPVHHGRAPAGDRADACRRWGAVRAGAWTVGPASASGMARDPSSERHATPAVEATVSATHRDGVAVDV